MGNRINELVSEERLLQKEAGMKKTASKEELV